MTSTEISEMEFLAAGLATTAARLRRAAVLLRTGGDIERAEARLTALAAQSRTPTAAIATVPAGPVVGRSGAVAAVSRLGSPTLPERASRGVAVFDHGSDRRRESAKIKTVGSPVPF